jgi:hypothetical protein
VLVAARVAAEEGVRIDGANRSRPVAADQLQADSKVFEIPEVVTRQMPAYKRAVFPVSGSQEPHEVSDSTLTELAKRIIVAEGPIHVEEAARRIASCFAKEKAGSRILSATRAALVRAQTADPDLLSDGAFWFMRAQKEAPPVRDRGSESGATLKADCISMIEIKAAIRIARNDNAGGDHAELVRTAARLLGFKRVGADLQSRLTSGLSGN